MSGALGSAAGAKPTHKVLAMCFQSLSYLDAVV